MFNVFGYLRNQARQAVLGGIGDALADVATDDKPADLEALRKMLADSSTRQLAAPVADDDETAAPARKQRAR